MQNINDVLIKIKEYYSENNVVPTVALFCKKYNINPATLNKNFGSWNGLLQKCNLKINKSNKRTNDELINWLKSHPDTKYSNIPAGIRTALEQNFGSITKAREIAGIKLPDKRVKNTKTHKNNNGGRPVEYTDECIISGLIDLAIKLKRPPRLIDVKKKTCGFTANIVLLRFGTFNNALQKADLPPTHSFHEYNKLCYELEILLMNMKLQTNNCPKYYKTAIDKYKPIFLYDDKLEFVFLSRSDIQKNISKIKSGLNANTNKQIVIYYLIDDSLYENTNITMINVNSLSNTISDIELINKLKAIRTKYDDLNRKYIWERAQIIKGD